MLVEVEVVEVELLEVEDEEEDDDENLDVLYEVNVMEDQRILDDDDVKVFGLKLVGKKREQLRVVNFYVFIGEGDNKW